MTRTSIGDPRFFARNGPHPLATVAEAALGAAPGVDLLLAGVAPLQTARPDEVSFLDNRRYAAALEATSAGVVIVHPDMLARAPAGTAPIVTDNPYAGWPRVAALFHPAPPVRAGVHPTAIVAAGACPDPPRMAGFLQAPEIATAEPAHPPAPCFCALGPRDHVHLLRPGLDNSAARERPRRAIPRG
jgi:UDP-3-O-[3-hydroxymyristoyl] glucosamine N-acyltransferase